MPIYSIVNHPLKVAKTQDSEWLNLIFSGELDESTNLVQLVGDLQMKVCLKTRAITRINSVGLKIWMSFFQRAKESGVELRYVDCSPVIANHLHSMRLSGGGGTVLSVIGPFECQVCHHEFEVSISTPNIVAIKPQITSQKCPICKGPAVFDEIPQEFFQFLMI